jgi:hypothetical protein
MILSSHGLIASQIASFDADAVAFFGRVTTAGGTLSATEKQAVNQLVLDLKANSLWTPMKAIYPMVGASAEACKQNLKSSSFTGSFSTGWTFSSSGVQGNGTSAFMGTGISASGQLSINSAHMSSYNNTTPSGGVMLGNGDLTCLLQYSGGQLYGSLGSSFINGSASMTASFIMVNRPSSTTLKIIRNNTIVLSNTSNNGISYNAANIDMARYGGSFYESSRFAFASIGDGLTDTQASNFYTAVQAFQTTLSRQV